MDASDSGFYLPNGLSRQMSSIPGFVGGVRTNFSLPAVASIGFGRGAPTIKMDEPLTGVRVRTVRGAKAANAVRAAISRVPGVIGIVVVHVVNPSQSWWWKRPSIAGDAGYNSDCRDEDASDSVCRCKGSNRRSCGRRIGGYFGAHGDRNIRHVQRVV
ncbi:hypothetical protein BJX76DRAFT_88885 [Aspergillus varians]